MKLRRDIQTLSREGYFTAVVVATTTRYASVRMHNKKILANLEVVGGPVGVGDTVNIQYFNGIPRVIATGNAPAVSTDITTVIDNIPDPVHQVRRQWMFELAGEFTAGAGALRGYNRFGDNFNLLEVLLTAGTVTTAVTVDVNVDGVSIFTDPNNQPSIASSGDVDITTAIDERAFRHGSYLTVDVVSGDGADLAVCILAE